MQMINPNGIPGMQSDMMMVLDTAGQANGADALGRLLDRYTPNHPLMNLDASPGTSGAFLQGELEKPDFNLNKPLSNFTWSRDIPYVSGGGFVDFTSNFFVNYGTAGANQYGLMGVDTNNLPTIQANVSKDVYPVHRFGYKILVPLVSQQRMQMVGRSLEDLLQDGLRLNYDLMLNANGYTGLTNIGTKGLVNQAVSNNAASETAVYQTQAAATGSGSSRKWRDKTPAQILDDLNTLINQVWANSQYDIDCMPNHVLIPPDDFAYINSQLVSTAGSQSILSYLKANNVSQAQGVDLQIFPCRQCIGQGVTLVTGDTNGSGRMIAYRNDTKRLHFDETVPLFRAITQPDADLVAYLSTYIASVGVLKILYFQTIAYMDGIS